MYSSLRMHSSDRDRSMCLTLCDHSMWLTLGSLLLVGCALFEHPQPAPVVVQPPATVRHEQVVVREPVIIRDTPPPPPPRMEVIATAPSPQHVWVPGYWAWRDDDWAWQTGHWELRPYPDALWVPGQWVATANGWRWKDGQWR